jgi:hypothetical protein
VQIILVSMAPHFVCGDGDMVEMGEFAPASHGIPLSRQSHGAVEETSPFMGKPRAHGRSFYRAGAGPKRALGNGPPASLAYLGGFLPTVILNLQ